MTTQPGFQSQGSAARIPQPRLHNQDSTARIIIICSSRISQYYMIKSPSRGHTIVLYDHITIPYGRSWYYLKISPSCMTMPAYCMLVSQYFIITSPYYMIISQYHHVTWSYRNTAWSYRNITWSYHNIAWSYHNITWSYHNIIWSYHHAMPCNHKITPRNESPRTPSVLSRHSQVTASHPKANIRLRVRNRHLKSARNMWFKEENGPSWKIKGNPSVERCVCSPTTLSTKDSSKYLLEN